MLTLTFELLSKVILILHYTVSLSQICSKHHSLHFTLDNMLKHYLPKSHCIIIKIRGISAFSPDYSPPGKYLRTVGTITGSKPPH